MVHGRRRRSKQLALVTTLGAVAMALVAAGCSSPGSGGSAAGGAKFDSTTLKTTAPSSISSNWVKWDTKSCKFVAAAQHPSTWTAQLRKPSGSFTLGLGEQDETNQVNLQMNASAKSTASQAGVNLVTGNYELPSTTAPISAAQSIVLRNPKVVVSNNQLDNIMSSVNNIYAQKCIPVVQVVVSAPNTVLFGPDNAAMGTLQGQTLAKYAKDHGWDPSTVTVFGQLDAPLGAAIQQRVTSCFSQIKSLLPGVKVDSQDNIDPATATAQSSMTDWLTANPDVKHLLVCSIADLYALGDANALKLANRASTAAVTGVNAQQDVLSAIAAGGPIIGSVDLGAATWGDYWVPLAEDIAAGQPVPAEIHPVVTMAPKK